MRSITETQRRELHRLNEEYSRHAKALEKKIEQKMNEQKLNLSQELKKSDSSAEQKNKEMTEQIQRLNRQLDQYCQITKSLQSKLEKAELDKKEAQRKMEESLSSQ
jgi:hypothetical protein